MIITWRPVGGAGAAAPTTNTAAVSFLQLYGDRLDRELGSSDRTKLFTTVRRKAAINEGAREFVKQTECLQRQGLVPLVSETAEYDLNDIDDYTWLTNQLVEIEILDSDGDLRVLGGDDLPLVPIQRLNREWAGWRNWDPGTPQMQYQREDGGMVLLGLTPAPLIAAGDTWSLVVPYLAIPQDMTSDTDGPFAIANVAKRNLWPWHQAPVHYAAAQLEKLRKNTEGIQMQMQMFAGYVADYLQKHRSKGGTQVGFARDYRRTAKRGRAWGGVTVDRDFV